VASRAAAGGAADSLYLLADGRRFPDGTVVASEPLDDDPGWEPVPEGRIVVVVRDREPRLELVA
ncbi:MAG: hypothetical protein QOK40_1274, partial [Miltoncostaeaceae bacterium]|nr:hypothetical protein [Miltoncostaeaceae bacterium]